MESHVFDYRVAKDGKVFLTWRGKPVKILSGKEAERFLSLVRQAGEEGAQLLMAKATGNFKRGNERSGKIR